MTNGELLKKARKKLEWTQEDMADYFNIDRSLVAHWEAERRDIPDAALKKAQEIRKSKKEDAQRRFKTINSRRSRGSKKGALNKSHEVNVTKGTVGTPKACGSRGSTPSLSHSPREICSKKGGSATLSGLSQDKAPVGDFSPPKEDSTEYFILECYVDFKKKNKRYPIDRDFMDGKTGDLHKQEVLKHFGCLSKAKLDAEKFRKSKRADHLRQNLIKDFPMITKVSENSTTSETGSFSCPCCGKLWRRSNRYYPVLEKTIKDRLESSRESKGYKEVVHGLLGFLFGDDKHQNCFCGGQFNQECKSSFKMLVSGRLERLLETPKATPSDAITDCLFAVFGREKHGANEIMCRYCLQYKDRSEITLDESVMASYICEDCYLVKYPHRTPKEMDYAKAKLVELPWVETKTHYIMGGNNEIACYWCGTALNDYEADVQIFSGGHVEFVHPRCKQ